MLTIKTMPKDTLSELLRYLSEHEQFESIEKLVGGEVSVTEVKAALRELADELSKEAFAEGTTSFDVKKCKDLSKTSKNVISSLSSREERTLLSKFGLIEPSTLRPCLSGRASLGSSKK